MLRELSRSDDPLCEGRVAVLWAGDTPVAAHLGLQCLDRLHYWFPAYDPEFGRYSFGQLLLLELIREGIEHGVRHVDLGKGESRYKNELATAHIQVGVGEVWRRTLSGFLTKVANSWRWKREARRQAVSAP